jgi:CheY-like chemotaxis protein
MRDDPRTREVPVIFVTAMASAVAQYDFESALKALDGVEV